MKSKEEFSDIIDALYESNNDGEILIYALLSMVIAHLNGIKFDGDEVKKQWQIIHSVFNDYKIKDMEHLQEKMEDCIMLRNGIDFKNMKPLGGVQ